MQKTCGEQGIGPCRLGMLALLALLGNLDAAAQPSPVVGLHRVDRESSGPAQCTLNAVPSNLPAGGSVPSSLSWSTSNAIRVTLNGGTVTSTGVLAVRPLANATYTLVAHGVAGTPPATCTRQIAVAQPACVNGAICSVACGTGMIPDIRDGQLVMLDHEHMVHVLLVAEGYTAADLARFHLGTSNDVDDWMDQWEALDVYNDFREAFCFWKLPAVSNARIVPGGAVEDTAFRVPVDSGGDVDLPSGSATDTVSARVWAEVLRLPFPPRYFYPTTATRTRGLAKNVVVSAMLYDPARGRSGYSGTTALLVNPQNGNQSVATAFSRNLAHEFTHAFARLRDEYLSIDGSRSCVVNSGAWYSSNVSNLSCDATCANVPWSHLVAGGAINPSQNGLIGAFGHTEDGYHSELKCLMNGDRDDNAEVYGGESELRTEERMCNFCRELTAFRLFERIGRLDDTATSYAYWETQYRQPFYQTYGFDVPAVVPMETPAGRPVFVPCR